MPLHRSADRPSMSAKLSAWGCAAMVCAALAIPALPFCLAFMSPAFAAECSDDIGNLTKKRQDDYRRPEQGREGLAQGAA